MTGTMRKAGACLVLVLGLISGLSARAEVGPEGRQNVLEAPVHGQNLTGDGHEIGRAHV